MDNNKEDLFEEFRAITGCKTNRRIAHYLEACDFDLATAVDLFFAQGGTDTAQDNDDVAMISDDEEEIECTQSSSSAGRPSTSKIPIKNGKNGYHEEAEVRAPIPHTRGTMVEAGYSQQYGGRHIPILQGDSVFGHRNFREEAIEQERRLRSVLNHMNVQPEVREPNANHEAAHHSMLQNLFRPPTDISFLGSFEGAKELACDIGKWLLVNVQDVQEFACQTLNRDIWSNEGVKELIRTNFVFWQIRHDSIDGQRMKNYYKLKSYPAIFILDPRTGELTQTIVMKKQDPVTLCDYLTSYLDKFPDYLAHDRFLKGDLDSTDVFSPENVPEYAAEPECSRSAMFEDEEMERTSRKRRGDEHDQNGKKARMETADVLNEPTRMLTVVDKDEWRQLVAKKGENCRIRLKLPDGKLETIEITNTSKLKALFLFIAGRNLIPKDHIFVLSFPRREYSIDHADRSLEELGFSKNEMVHVELK